MAGFCIFCGNPLPEDGVCPCRAQANAQAQPDYQQPNYQAQYQQAQQPNHQTQYQQPQQPEYQPQYQQPQQPEYQAQYQQPYNPYQPNPGYSQQPYNPYPPMAPTRQGPSVISKFLATVSEYLKDPVHTSREVMDRKDIISGGISLALCSLLILLGSLFFVLARGYEFGDRVPSWIVMGLFAPIAAVGITFAVIFALARIGKQMVDPMGLFAAVCINTLIPAFLLGASMLLSMIGTFVFELFAILMFAAWIVTTFTLIFQVLNIKMNIISIAVLMIGIAVAYVLIVLMLNWFFFHGNIQFFLADLYAY